MKSGGVSGVNWFIDLQWIEGGGGGGKITKNESERGPRKGRNLPKWGGLTLT